MRERIRRNLDDLFFLLGCILINVTLENTGHGFGWWGFMFWAGIGCFYAVWKSDD